MPVHLLKLSVGSESMATLAAWQASPRAQGADNLPRHITRMWPRRAAEVLDGGSIYWVIRGVVLCRQPVLRLDAVTGEDGIERCAIVLGGPPVAVVPMPRRPFQGWRYLAAPDAPADLSAESAAEAALPAGLSLALAEIGVL